MTCAIVFVLFWPVAAGMVGAWVARASYDWLWPFIARSPRYRRFGRAVSRMWGRA